MTSNRNQVLVLLTALLVLALLFAASWTAHMKSRGGTPRTTSALPASQPAVPASGPRVNPSVNDTTSGGGGRDPDRVKRVIESSNVSINFWGKIQDQSGKPLPDVKILYSVRRMGMNILGTPTYRTDVGETKSDASGAFAINGKQGDGIEFDSFQKAGYQLSSRTARTFAYVQAPTIFTPDQHHPVVFTMVKPANPLQLTEITKRISVPCDGTPVTFDLTNNSPNDRRRLKISCLREPAFGPVPARNYPWSLTMTLDGGGFVSLDPGGFYQAPAQGYQPETTYKMSGVGAAWQSTIAVNFYIKTGDNLYGRLSVQFSLNNKDPDALMGLDAVLNETGSRDLEMQGVP